MTDDEAIRRRYEAKLGGIEAEVKGPLVFVPARSGAGRRTQAGPLLIAAVALIAAAAILSRPSPAPDRAPVVAASPESSSTQSSSPRPCAPAAPAKEAAGAATQEAVAFRTRVGLETDPAWIAGVEADPAAAESFGVLLLPCEARALDARPRDAEALAPLVARHAEEYPAGYGGSFVEPDGTFVLLYTSGASEHESVLRRAVHPEARLAVRTAKHTRHELEELRDRIAGDEGWFSEIGARLISADVSQADNAVVLLVRSDDGRVNQLIESRYGAGDRLAIRSYPTDIAALGRGNISGRAVSESGQPVAGLHLVLVPEIPGAGPDTEIARSTGPDGSFRFDDIHALGYEVQLVRLGLDNVVVASARVVVPAGDTATVVIVVPNT